MDVVVLEEVDPRVQFGRAARPFGTEPVVGDARHEHCRAVLLQELFQLDGHAQVELAFRQPGHDATGAAGVALGVALSAVARIDHDDRPGERSRLGRLGEDPHRQQRGGQAHD